MKNNFFKINTISNLFVVISFVWFILYFLWLYDKFFQTTDLFSTIIRCLIYTFVHWWILHFFWNAIFLLYFWNIVEKNIWWIKYMFLFIFSMIFVRTWLLLLEQYRTIWISWFCMAILWYYIMYLKSRNDPELIGWIMFLVINIVAWFSAWISFWWHFLWAIAWIICYYIIPRNK